MKRIFFLFISFLFISASFAQKSKQIQQEMSKLNDATNKIRNLYVDTVNTHELVENAIVGMLEKLDPHSVYIPKEEVSQKSEPLLGNFEGIGVQFQMMADTLHVEQTIAGGPSEKVGILPGDRIVIVNDTTIAGVKMTSSDIMKRLRGKKGTSVMVKVARRGISDLIEFKIVRDKIPLYSVDVAYMIKPTIGYIKLSKFSLTTQEEFETALKSLKKQGMKNLIFDLQGNGGGYLSAATDILNEFLKKNQLIVYTEGRLGRKNFISQGRGMYQNGKIIVLTDEYSASASEIFSGAIQDWDRGLIVGRRTFGKGLVQQQLMLNDGSMIRLTMSRYYTPSGRSIQRPYGDGVEKYNKELVERYNRGELIHEDSIHFPDSLKKETLVLKRTVYGGGGIMPDYFVPLDTTFNSSYLTKLIAKGVLSSFVSQYFEIHGDEMVKNYPTFEKFNTLFNTTESQLQELLQIAENEKIEFNKDEYEKSKSFISTQLKALFARRLWDMGEYYKVMNSENDACQKAIEIFSTKNMYEDILTKKR